MAHLKKPIPFSRQFLLLGLGGRRRRRMLLKIGDLQLEELDLLHEAVDEALLQ